MSVNSNGYIHLGGNIRNIYILLLLSLSFSQELKVEGNLNVTGIVINDSLTYLIDSLQTQITVQQTLIEQLSAQILQLGEMLGFVDCNGEFNGDATEDNCGVCDKDASNNCLQDCAGNWGGDTEIDACGLCGGDALSEYECYGVYDIDGNGY